MTPRAPGARQGAREGAKVARTGAALGLACSLALHVVAWLLWPAPPAPRTRLAIDLLLTETPMPPPPRAAPPPASPEAAAPEAAPEAATPEAATPEAATPEAAAPPAPDGDAASGPPEASPSRRPLGATPESGGRGGRGGRGWRARLRAREEAHRSATAEHARKWALVQRSEAAVPGRLLAMDTAVRRCTARGPGPRRAYQSAREARAYASVVPAGLFPSSYVAQMWELSGMQGDSRWYFALPPEPLSIPLDEPAGHLVVAGRSDARCAVGVDLSPETLFPVRFAHVPVRVVDAQDRISSSVVDIELFGDGTFAWRRVAGDALPFARGALYDHATVGRNLQEHYVRARVLRDVAKAWGRD